jgi:CHAD domain-containing protein
MPYRFNPTHPPAREFARVAHEELASAIQQLRVGAKTEQAKAVHEARKSIKKLRALLRLIAPHLNATEFGTLNHALRNTGRTLSVLRDAQVMRETAEALLKDKRVDGESGAIVRERLAVAWAHARKRIRIPAAFEKAAAALADLKDTEFSAVTLPPGDWRILKPGLKKTYKRGRRAMIEAEREQDPESFHEWRKRVKEHWYHARLLGGFGNGVWEKRESDLKKLETLLGDDHNLVLMREAIGDRDKEVKPFLRLLKERSRELRGEALQLGDRLYADSWSDLADQLAMKKPAAVA